jgi:type IV pilus assembly protein PilO
MPDLKKTRNKLTIAVVALALADIAAGALLLSPIAGSEHLRRQQESQLWQELKSRQSAPWRGLDKKIPKARQDINTFYQDRMPSGYSAISTDVDRIAAESGVRMLGEKYDQKDVEVDGLQRVDIDADVSGDYLQLVRFINALERNKLFFIVNDLELGGEQSGTVKLRIKLETYLRTGS